MAYPQTDISFLEDEDDAYGAAQATQRALIDTQERMGMMLDIMPMGLLIHTRQGILFANQEACAMLQTGAHELVGRHVLDFVAPGEFAKVSAQIKGSFSHNENIEGQETRLIRADGEEMDIKLLSSHLPWPGTPVVQILLQDVSDLKRKEQKLQRLATTDHLTGIYNRRHVFDEAAMYIEGAGKNFKMSVILLDVDHFKKINDTYGHCGGDQALICLTQRVEDVLKFVADDKAVFARLGGEEFLVLLPGIAVPRAMEIAEHIRLAIEQMKITYERFRFSMTISLGVSRWHRDEDACDGAINRADDALYRAKETGRNQSHLAING